MKSYERNQKFERGYKNRRQDIVVTDGKNEYFRKQKTKQTISIENDFYFAEIYMEV